MEQVELIFSDREEIEHLTLIVGDLNQLVVAAVADYATDGFHWPVPNGTSQFDDVVFLDGLLDGCHDDTGPRLAETTYWVAFEVVNCIDGDPKD